MKKITLFIAGFAISLFGALAVVPVSTTLALDPLAICDDPANAGNAVCANRTDSAEELISTLVSVLLFIVGALSVVMIIYAGIRYVISAGNAAAVTSAKNTLLYAIVGLVVSFLAYAIVFWVLDVL